MTSIGLIGDAEELFKKKTVNNKCLKIFYAFFKTSSCAQKKWSVNTEANIYIFTVISKNTETQYFLEGRQPKSRYNSPRHRPIENSMISINCKRCCLKIIKILRVFFLREAK